MGLGLRKYTFDLGFDEYSFVADLSDSSASIRYADGEYTPWQTADAQHCKYKALELLLDADAGQDYWHDPSYESVKISVDDYDDYDDYTDAVEKEEFSAIISGAKLIRDKKYKLRLFYITKS